MSFSIPHLTKEHLVKQLTELGVSQADTIMVHASLRAVGEILGGPDMLISALCQTLGRDGTIMVYVGCQSPFDDIGRGIYGPADEDFILDNCPAFEFDAARASRDFGAFADSRRRTTRIA